MGILEDSLRNGNRGARNGNLGTESRERESWNIAQEWEQWNMEWESWKSRKLESSNTVQGIGIVVWSGYIGTANRNGNRGVWNGILEQSRE